MAGVSNISFLGTLSSIPLLPEAPTTPPRAAPLVISAAVSAETTPVSSSLVARDLCRSAASSVPSSARIIFGSGTPATIASPATPLAAARVVVSAAASAEVTPVSSPSLVARNTGCSATSSVSSCARIVFGCGTPAAIASPATPPPAARAAVDPMITATPPAIRNLGRQPKTLLETSPDGEGKARIAGGVAALRAMVPEQRRRAALNLWKVFRESISEEDPTTPLFHRAAERYFKSDSCSRTGTEVVSALSEVLGIHARIVPIAHLCGEEESGGGHLYGLLEEVLARNSATGVCFGKVRTARREQKLSSVFPERIGLEDVIAMLQNPTTIVIASCGNRCLQRIESGLFIECYFRNPIGFSSVFPVFFVGEYQEGETYQLTDTVTVSAETILGFALEEVRQKIARGQQPASYFISADGEIQTIIIDLARHLSETFVTKGILFSFSRRVASDVFKCFPADFFTTVS